MKAAAAVCRGGLLLQARLRDRARARPGGVSVCLAASVRRRLVAAALPEPLAPIPVAEDPAPQEAEEEVAFAELLPPPDVFEKTVHVRFVLQKKCMFSQHFLLVGDDPALGLWDPTKATTLNWSEGHVWTVNKDLPANKLIEFKFLLQESPGKFRWQDGPNRTLQIGETSNILVVYEDWDASGQEVSEEGEPSIGTEEAVLSDDCAGGNIAMLEDELPTDGNQETKQQLSVGVDDKSTAVADVPLLKESMVVNEVKQPKLIVHQVEKIPDELPEKTNTVTVSHNLAKEPKIPHELPQKVNTVNSNVAVSADDGHAEKTGDDIMSEEDSPIENRSAGIAENDMLWGRKALQQLLVSLGFKTETT